MTHTAADLHRRFPVGSIIQIEPLPGRFTYALVTGHSRDGLDVIEATDDGLEPGEVEAFMVAPEKVRFAPIWRIWKPKVRDLRALRRAWSLWYPHVDGFNKVNAAIKELQK